MALSIDPIAELTEPERSACVVYRTDATFLHACAQGWIDKFPDSKMAESFLGNLCELRTHLDQAIQKYKLSADGVLYSGHGCGISVVGALRGQPQKFIDLKYCYPGYTSTSEDKDTAENFLRTRASRARTPVLTPVLMEFNLKKGQPVLPIEKSSGQCGEAEYLLGRSIEFEITCATFRRIQGVDQDILHLVLT